MSDKFIPIFTKSEIAKVKLDEIIHIKSELRMLEICTYKRKYRYYAKLDSLTNLLDERFFRCYCGCIVNFDYVDSARDGALYMENDDVIYMGKTKFQIAKTAYKTYLQAACDRMIRTTD